MNNNETNEQLSRCKQTRYMIASSCFFLYPVYYGLSRKIYSHSLLLLICCLTSINYWRYPIVSTRRNIDIAISNITMIDYIINGFLYLRNPMWFTIGLANGGMIGYMFYRSTTTFNKKLPYWWKYHILFHLFSAINQTVVLSSIRPFT